MPLAKSNKSEIQLALAQLPEWKIKKNGIFRKFKLDNFGDVSRFVYQVALLSKNLNHDPDMKIRPDGVDLYLTTHDVGGLSILDFEFARRISQF